MSKRKRRNKQPRQQPKQSTPQKQLQKAKSLYQAGQRQQAITVLQKAVRVAPNNAPIQHILGTWLIEDKQPDAGMDCYDKALIADPEYIPTLIALAQRHSNHREVDEALPLINRARELQPGNPSVCVIYGSVMQQRGELPIAVEQFRSALDARLNGNFTDQEKPASKDNFDNPETETLMWQTLSTLAKSGVHAFPCFGTLLGLVREGGLLSFDKDVDLGVPYSEFDRTRRCLERNGWVKAGLKGMTNPQVYLHQSSSLTIDISGFVVDKDTGGTYEGIWLDNVPWEWSRNTRFPSMELEKDTSPDGQPIWMLRQPETWLEALYGDWQTPDPNFDTIICAHNLCGFTLLTQCYAFSRIYHKWKNGEFIKGIALCDHTLKHLPDDELIQKVRAEMTASLPKEGKDKLKSVPTTSIEKNTTSSATNPARGSASMTKEPDRHQQMLTAAIQALEKRNG